MLGIRFSLNLEEWREAYALLAIPKDTLIVTGSCRVICNVSTSQPDVSTCAWMKRSSSDATSSVSYTVELQVKVNGK